MSRLAASMRELGPYAAIAVVVPGGSLIALSVWAVRRRAWALNDVRRMLVMMAAVAVALVFPAG
jgi:hypothetical protein